MAGPQVQLPSGYQDAAPVAAAALKLPAGFEDAAPVKPPLGHDIFGDVPDNLYTRIGARIKANFDLPAQIRNASDAISEAIYDVKQNGLFTGKHRLPEVIQSLKDTYKVPANVIGDLLSLGIMHAATPVGEAAPVRAGEAPTVRPPAASYPPGAEPPAPAIPGNQLPQIPGVNIPPSIERIAPPAEGPIPGVDIRPSIERIQNFQPPKPAPAAPPKVTPAAIESQLTESLGGQKLVPGVSLKNQPAVMAAAAGKLPEGFTPVESSALRGYKYNPATQEFESITKTGQHYVHGDVSPEQVEAFEAADSKGKAWGNLKSNSTLVAKVLNGKRVPVKPLSASSAEPALDDILSQMLQQVKSGKSLKDLQ